MEEKVLNKIKEKAERNDIILYLKSKIQEDSISSNSVESRQSTHSQSLNFKDTSEF